MDRYDISEILQFAIHIEEGGEYFYNRMVEKSDDERLKKIFSWLASEEVVHKRTFSDMLNKIKNYDSPEAYPEDYFSYLKAYTQNIIFKKEDLDTKIDSMKDVGDAIDFAIARELEAVLYYKELKEMISKDQHSIIDKIIDEERRHFMRLRALKDEYNK